MDDPVDTIDEQEGVIKMINKDKGFGFIRRNGDDLFFHVTECGDTEEGYKETFEDLVVGSKVTFHVADGKKGPEGRNVRST